MSVNFKVIGGTPVNGKSLCATCRWAHCVRGYKESQELFRCGVEMTTRSYGSQLIPMPFPVAKCSHYIDQRIPLLAEMEVMALTIDPERVRVSGFAPKKDQT
jgi:hypothetical protein